MNKIFLAMCLSVILLIAGCGGKTVYQDDDTTVTVDGANKVVSKVQTEEGEQVTTVTGSQGLEGWCPEGGDWAMTSAGVQGDTTATWKVDRLQTSGKYQGLCHVIYSAKGPEGDVVIDYYFAEDGQTGYLVMEANGQKFEQEWHAQQ